MVSMLISTCNTLMVHFWGVHYDHSYPPPRQFQNASNCRQHTQFLNNEILSRLQSGAISLVGKFGEVDPPHIASPITVEPTKPRMCINLMYLSCFMKDTPFNLETLVDVTRTVDGGSFLTKLDDKSGYDNVCVTNSSRKLLGVQWGGYYFCCNTLPFGWKNSAYVYHTLNLQAISFLRKKSISCLLYIDDRLIESFHGYVPANLDNPFMRAHVAIRYAVIFFISLGYFFSIDKCIFLPTQSIVFLGMIIYSAKRSFFITEKRKQKMATLREIILSNKSCPVSLIQKFAGLCISMTLAILGVKLYSSACNRAISKALLSNTVVDVDTEIREEVAYWQSLDKWSQPFPWLNERHDVLSISSDSSDYKWAAIYTSGHEKYEIADYWSDDVKESPIMIKEALALKNALSSYGSQIKNKRIETKVDNQAVVFAWKNQYSKNGILNSILKDIFQITIQNNCYLNLSYIRTSENPSDVLSGVIPSQTFCQGVIPSQTFCQGVIPSQTFCLGVIPSQTFCLGIIPSQTFCQGVIPSQTFCQGLFQVRRFVKGYSKSDVFRGGSRISS